MEAKVVVLIKIEIKLRIDCGNNIGGRDNNIDVGTDSGGSSNDNDGSDDGYKCCQ